MDNENKLDNSEKNDELNAGGDTAENKSPNDDKSSEKKAGDATPEKKESDKEDKGNNKIPDYRPKKKDDKSQFVPLAKYVAKKNEIKQLNQKLAEAKSSTNSNNKDFEDLADELGVSVDAVKKMSKLFGPKEDLETKKKIEIILEKEKRAENEKNFKKDFDRWAKDNPDRLSKKEFYHKISFDPDYTESLPTLNDMEKHFFPKETKKTNIENGSNGQGKNVKVVDLKNLDDKDEREAVARNPKAVSKLAEKIYKG